MLYERVKIFTDVNTLIFKRRSFIAILIAISAILFYIFAKPFYFGSKVLKPYDYSRTFSPEKLKFNLQLPDEPKTFASSLTGEIYFTEYLKEGSSATGLFKYDLSTGIKSRIDFHPTGKFHFARPKFFDNGREMLICKYVQSKPSESELIAILPDGEAFKHPFALPTTNNCEFDVTGPGAVFVLSSSNLLRQILPENFIMPVFSVDWDKNYYYPTYSPKTERFYYVAKALQGRNLELQSEVFEVDVHKYLDGPVEIFSHGTNITRIALSPDGLNLLVTAESDVVFKLDLSTKATNRIFTKNQSTIRSAFWSNDLDHIFLARGVPDNDLIRLKISGIDDGEQTSQVIISNFVGNDPVMRPSFEE